MCLGQGSLICYVSVKGHLEQGTGTAGLGCGDKRSDLLEREVSWLDTQELYPKRMKNYNKGIKR